jgi:hypothetical protein
MLAALFMMKELYYTRDMFGSKPVSLAVANWGGGGVYVCVKI